VRGDIHMRSYFVSYLYRIEGIRGFACCRLNIEGCVFGWDSILAMVSEIRRLNPEFTEVIILNWRRFEDPE
jgi:hypothetical protein